MIAYQIGGNSPTWNQAIVRTMQTCRQKKHGILLNINPTTTSISLSLSLSLSLYIYIYIYKTYDFLFW